MKARACTKCRQWKAKCDATESTPEGCSRCRALKIQCVFDASFKRISKAKRIQQMTLEIQQLKEALLDTTKNSVSPPHARRSERENDLTLALDWVSQIPSVSDDVVEVSLPEMVSPLPPSLFRLEDFTRRPSTGADDASSSRTLGTVSLTQSQADQRFMTYFSRCHQYLPFKIETKSAEELYLKSPLLFWVICTVTSAWKVQSQLAPFIKSMVADSIHASSRGVETVQALLILCMWPFKVSRLTEDPSLLYSGLASQMCLQLGRQRLSQLVSPGTVFEADGTIADDGVRLTTWLACFIVNQIQSSCLGVPPSVSVNANLLQAFEDPKIDITLSQLCRTYILLGEANVAISTTGSTPSGMLEPGTRLSMIKLYGEQFSELQNKHLSPMSAVVRISLLHARIQLWSFALLDDMPFSEDILPIVKTAEEDSNELIDLCHDFNLSSTPYHVRRSIYFAAIVLVKILRSPYHQAQRELLEDNIERARQALISTARSQDDIVRKACEMLQQLPYLEDKKRGPPVLSRMSASLMFDLTRVYWEDWFERNTAPGDASSEFDLDAIDWDALGL